MRELARKGAHVILASRSVERGEAARKDICAAIEGSACNVDVWPLDLSSLASVDKFAAQFLKAGPTTLDMLILNAGVMACPYTETADGVEMQFGTNHLGHFYLTKRLMPVLESSKARVVTVSSNAHEHSYSGGIRFNQLTSSEGYDMVYVDIFFSRITFLMSTTAIIPICYLVWPMLRANWPIFCSPTSSLVAPNYLVQESLRTLCILALSALSLAATSTPRSIV